MLELFEGWLKIESLHSDYRASSQASGTWKETCLPILWENLQHQGKSSIQTKQWENDILA